MTNMLKATSFCAEMKSTAIEMGFWKDDFMASFVEDSSRKLTGNNHFIHMRVTSVDLFIHKFLKQAGNAKTQIINLGSGYDTWFWRLKEEGFHFRKFVELDLPDVSSSKCSIIKNSSLLQESLRSNDVDLEIGETEVHSKEYHLMPADLNNISEIETKLKSVGIDFSVPTLIFTEYVLIFVKTDKVDKVLNYFSANFEKALFVSCELCNIHCDFAKMIMGRMNTYECLTAGSQYCLTLETQKAKFVDNKWEGSKAWDAWNIYNSLPVDERKRIENIEPIDSTALQGILKCSSVSIGWMGDMFSDIELND